jgi:FkbM family methyltransferase
MNKVLSTIIIIIILIFICIKIYLNCKTRKTVKFLKENNLFYNKNDMISLYALHKDIFIDHEYDIVLKDNKENKVIFDVGANVGLFCLRANQICNNNIIYSFEPIKEIYGYLEKNSNILNMQNKNKFIPTLIGLGEKEEEIMINYYPNMSATSTTCSDIGNKIELNIKSPLFDFHPIIKKIFLLFVPLVQLFLFQKKVEKIKINTISHFIKKFNVNKIDLLKIDVECFEYIVLKGIQNYDWKKINSLIIEIESYRVGALDNIKNLLTKNNYEIINLPISVVGWINIYAKKIDKKNIK